MIQRGRTSYGDNINTQAADADAALEKLYKSNKLACLQIVGYWWKRITEPMGR